MLCNRYKARLWQAAFVPDRRRLILHRGRSHVDLDGASHKMDKQYRVPRVAQGPPFTK